MTTKENNMTLRDLIRDAEEKLDTFKYPNIDEARAKLDELITAAELGSLKNESIDSISLSDDTLFIQTSHTSYSCSDSSTYRLPASILDANDPVKAAKIWGVEQKIQSCMNEIRSARRSLEFRENELAKLTGKLAVLAGQESEE